MRIMRGLLMVLGLIAFVVLCAWGYTSMVISYASRDGVYPTAEQAMIAMVDKGYSADRQVKIIYAGTNSFDGSTPHIWYVIAEVRASSRADDSSLNRNGCDAPGTFFLQTKEGWVRDPNGFSLHLLGN